MLHSCFQCVGFVCQSVDARLPYRSVPLVIDACSLAGVLPVDLQSTGAAFICGPQRLTA
ncbi:MAG: hypothetical protein ACLUBZ_17460 [Ruthenibacterium lactatiformans]|uniref:hypothetical protein n=1 Tax=Ruthenibacterium lactatiformans TaxID=1550024 RepID=UPI0039955CBA